MTDEGREVFSVSTEDGFDSSGYLKWPEGQVPRSIEEALAVMRTMGFDHITPRTHVAGAILDGQVEERLRIGNRSPKVIAFVFQPDPDFAVARQVHPLIEQKDLNDLVMRSLVGGAFQNGQYVAKFTETPE